MHSIGLSSARTTRQLFISLGILVALHLGVAFGHLFLHWRLEALTQLVDLDLEANMPTFFNAFLFIIGAAIFLLHGRVAEKSMRSGWNLMAGVFLFLALDEGSQIHEKFMFITLRLMDHGGQHGADLGWFYYAWVIPYGLAGIGLVLMLSRWLLKLDGTLRKGLVISGIIYVFGAVFLEMAGGKLAKTLPFKDPGLFPWMPCGVYDDPSSCWLYMEPRYIALYTMEEICEMTGLILCIHYLLKAFETKNLKVALTVAEEE